MPTGTWCGEPKEGDRLEEPGADLKIILKWIFKEWDGSMDSLDLPQDMYRCRAFVNAVMSLRVP